MLKTVILSKNIQCIASSMFLNCSSLSNIEIPPAVTRIEPTAFSGCSSITNIILPEGLENIGAKAFSTCRRLKKINIPANVKKIGYDAFEGCWDLKEVILEEGVEIISSSPFSNGIFYNCYSLVKVIMPQSLHTIDPNAFNGATNSVIYGIKNSYAQEYAKQYQIAFMDINSFGQEILTKNIDSNITKQSDLPEVTLPLAIIKSGTSNISYTLMYAILEYMDIPYDLVRSPVRTVHLQSGVGFPTDEPAFYIYYGKNNEKMVGYYFEADSCSDLPIGTPFKTIMVAMGFKEYNGFDGLDYIFNIDEELERTKENLEWSKANGLTIIGLHLAGQEERNDNLHYNEKIIELVVPYCDLVIVTEESDLDGKFTNLSDELKIPLVKIDKLKASSVVPLFQDIFDIE